MAMKKIIFKGLPNTTTPLSADNLNAIQNNAEAYIEPLKQNILSDNLFDLNGKQKHYNSTIVINKTEVKVTSTTESSTACSQIELLDLKPNKKYKLTAEIKMENVSDSQPARIGIINNISGNVLAYAETNSGTYIKKEFEFTTPSDTSKLAIIMYARIGGSGTQTKYYKNVMITEENIDTDTYIPYVNALEGKINSKIPSFAGDLNTIKTTGFIYALGTATNTPQTGYSYYVTTISLGQNYVLQKASRVVSGKQYYEFERQCFNGTWLDWVQTSGANISTGVEFKTGRIIGGKEEYGKRINFGTLPNATTKNIAHGLSNITVRNIECEFKNSTTQIIFNSYGINPTNTKPLIVYVSSSNINIYCEGDSSAYTGYVTLYYTKNS